MDPHHEHIAITQELGISTRTLPPEPYTAITQSTIHVYLTTTHASDSELAARPNQQPSSCTLPSHQKPLKPQSQQLCILNSATPPATHSSSHPASPG